MGIVPQTTPRLGYGELAERVGGIGFSLADNPVTIVGIRGYYRDTMGVSGRNDRGIYDDAIFLVTPGHFASYNANTDPSVYRAGQGKGSGKGMARLNPGVWRAHRFGLHRGKYMALIQTGGSVTVTRDGTPDYADSGWFGINIHRGGYNTTSSLGCQTIYPAQWAAFIESAQDQARRFFGPQWKQTTIPYVLLENA